MSRRLQTISWLAIVAISVAACGSGEVLGPPDGEDQPLIQVSSEGGFVPVEVNIGRGPTFTVTRDKTFIFPGVTTLEYPGALIPAVFTGELTDEQYDHIFRLIQEMGIEDIEDEVDNSDTNVADASTEVIKYWDQDGVHKYSVYALGISDQPQSDLTAAFAELFEYLHELSGSVAGEPFQPEKFRVVASRGFVEPDPDFVDIRPWPLDDESPGDWAVLTEVGDQTWTCKAISADQASALSAATQATLWANPSGSADVPSIKLLVRPLHPGEGDCSFD